MLPVSAPLWELLPIASLVQFPWRLLALTAVALAVLSGFAIRAPDTRKLNGQVLVLALVAILGSFAYTLPQYTPTPEHAEEPLLSIEFELNYTDMRGMTAWTEEMPETSPLVEQYLSGADLVTAEVLAPDATLEMIRAGGASDEVWVRSPEGTALRFYTYYFPGWRVYYRWRAPARGGPTARDGLRPDHGGRPARRAPGPVALGGHAAAHGGQGADAGQPGDRDRVGGGAAGGPLAQRTVGQDPASFPRVDRPEGFWRPFGSCASGVITVPLFHCFACAIRESG